MRRLICLLLLLCLLPAAALGEGTLHESSTVEAISQFVLLPEGEALPAAARGYIRYITMNEKDDAFLLSAWQSADYDLTVKKDGKGNTYRADHNNMHNRAVYCMAMSYLGVDVTPVMMSELAGSRDISAPYDAVTRKLGNVERVAPKAYAFNTMVNNYLKDDRYSPVFVQIRKPNGAQHVVLIVGYIPETGGFIIVDPAAPKQDGKTLHTYPMAWHVMREVVLSSAFYDAFYASKVEALYQWRLVE